MKPHVSTLWRSALLVALALLLGTISSVPVRADGPVPPATPTGITVVSPPPARSLPAFAGAWVDGTIKYSTILDCWSELNGDPYQVYGTGTFVGFYANASSGQPVVNSVYYVDVVVEGVGDSCAGQNAYVDIGLPPNTSLAISTANPVICYINGQQMTGPDCPQSLPSSSYNANMYDIRAPQRNNYTWPLPTGEPWEFQVPVISTTTLSGSLFQAKVQVYDGQTQPWLNPTVGIYVFAPPAPLAFNKSGPASGVTGQPTSLNLSWGSSSGAARYEYCLDTVNNNACDASWVSTSTSTSKSLSGLANGTQYFWQVRAVNAGGTTYANGSSTAWWSFTTQPLPGSFNKSGPTNAATGQPVSLNLSWGASSTANSYEYCIDTFNNNACDSVWIPNGSSTGKALSGLAYATAYYWQVRAINNAGSTYADSGAWWSFTTLSSPGAFNKASPANAAVKQSSSPTLRWNASSAAASYEYCLDTINNSACDTAWHSTGAATSQALSGLAHGVRYYWQVRANNDAGSTYADAGAWWSFTTLALPAAFNKTSPAKGATNQVTNPTLRWNASSGATSYEYCIDTSNNNTCNSVWHSTGTARSKTLSGLAHGVKYYWQVRARNSAGYKYANGSSTAWWNFITH